MNTIRFTSIAALLLTACATVPEASAPAPQIAQQQQYGGWVDQFHEPRGREECRQGNGAAGDAFLQCIRGWHERIWVPDMTNPGTPSVSR